MKRLIYILFGFLLFSLHTQGQSSASIIDELNSPRQGQGNIVIYQDNIIKNLVNTQNVITTVNVDKQLTDLNNSVPTSSTEVVKTSTVNTRGFRIQVYSGNDQKKSRTEAYSRRDQVHSLYPNMEVTIAYHSPVWRVRAGNFRTRAEAQQALNEMKPKFPSFGKEMHIVDDVVKIPAY